MKKIFSIILCAAVVLVSGCSGDYPEGNNKLAEENSSLSSVNSRLQSENDELTSKLDRQLANNTSWYVANSKLTEEYEELKSKYDELTGGEVNDGSSSTDTTSNTQPPKSDETDYGFDVQKWMLGKPESTIVKSETEQYDKNVELETTYYYDNSKFAIKMVYAMDDTVSPFTVALHIFSYEKAMNDAMPNFMEDMVTEYVIIYQYASGDIIMSSYWYLDKNNSIQHLQQWTSIEQNDDIIDKFNELAGN